MATGISIGLAEARKEPGADAAQTVQNPPALGRFSASQLMFPRQNDGHIIGEFYF